VDGREDWERRMEDGEGDTEDGQEEDGKRGKGKGEMPRDFIAGNTSARRLRGLMPGIFDNSSSYLAAISQRRLSH